MELICLSRVNTIPLCMKELNNQAVTLIQFFLYCMPSMHPLGETTSKFMPSTVNKKTMININFYGLSNCIFQKYWSDDASSPKLTENVTRCRL